MTTGLMRLIAFVTMLYCFFQVAKDTPQGLFYLGIFCLVVVIGLANMPRSTKRNGE